MLFTQSLRKERDGTSVDNPSPKSPVSTLTPSMNFNRVTAVQSLPSPKKKSSIPKRSITFADLPPSSREESVNYPTSPSTKKYSSSLHDNRYISDPQITSYKKVYRSPIQNTQSRFKLPPTPLTAPPSMGDYGTSISFGKRQNARSVDGTNQVEVGFKKHVYKELELMHYFSSFFIKNVGAFRSLIFFLS